MLHCVFRHFFLWEGFTLKFFVVLLLPANEKVEDINASPRSQSHMVSLLVHLSSCGGDSIITLFIFAVMVLKCWPG